MDNKLRLEELLRRIAFEKICTTIRAKNIKQKSAVDMVKEYMSTSQSTISRIMTGDKMDLSVYELVNYCLAFDIDINEIIKDYVDERNILMKSAPINFNYGSKTNKRQLQDGVNNQIEQYKGSYYCYYLSTISLEDRILECELTLAVDANTQENTAFFQIPIPAYDESGKEIKDAPPSYKNYSGTFMINPERDVINCILNETDSREMSHINFRYISISNPKRKYEGGIAAVVTTSASDKRRPTLHKMILTRTKLKDEQLDYAYAQLLMNTEIIEIEEKQWEKLKVDMSKDSKYEVILSELTKEIDFLRPDRKVMVYRIAESTIYDWKSHNKQSNTLPQQCISVLRRYSTAQKYIKVSDTAEEILRTLIRDSGRK